MNISCSKLLSVERKLPRYLNSFTFSNTFPLALVFLVLRVFSFMSLIGLGWVCILMRPTVSAVSKRCPFLMDALLGAEKEAMQCRRRSLYIFSGAFNPHTSRLG